MDFVMMIVVAPADQAQEIADSECPMDEWQGIEAAEVTPSHAGANQQCPDRRGAGRGP